MNSFYDFSVPGLDGSANILAPLRGKVALAVNVASKCGYTPQYALLEELYEELRNKNFTVIGFPCNQFGAQEPGTAAEIQSFCTVNFGVTFPLSAKIDVNGPHRDPLYAWLTADENGWKSQECLSSKESARKNSGAEAFQSRISSASFASLIEGNEKEGALARATIPPSSAFPREARLKPDRSTPDGRPGDARAANDTCALIRGSEGH